MGSFQMFANIIGRCVRIDRSDKRKTFISEFTIPGNQDRPSGKIRVVTSALDKSEIMLPEDLLLVDVVYSKIKELLRSKHGITYPLRNLFTLDKVDIAHDLHKTDSGAGRELLHQQFERINATEYDVESCENARWLMRQFQFINEIGEVYDKKRIRWLSIEGERYDPNGSERSKRASRYISVSLPEFLFDAINNWLKTREGDILPMFTRDKKLVKQSAAGQIWALNNYLDMIAPRPGNYRKPIGLDKFITSFVPHMEEKRQIEYLSIVKILIDKDRLIYAFNLSINIRKQPRLKYAASLVGRHLIVLRNITPSASQLSRIKYDIEHVKLNDTQHNVAKEQLAKVKAEPNYQDDEHAYKWIQSILDSSSFFAKEQNV